MVKSDLQKIVIFLSCLLLSSCGSRIERFQDSLEIRSQQDPVLSGDGQKLALIVEYKGRLSVQLRDLRNGEVLRLRHLSRNQPHSSPSLSWNGRYLAVIAQRGNRRLVIIEDRLTGRSHHLLTPRERIPLRLSLAPDATQVAIQMADKGKWRIELFDLSKTIESDQPRGRISNTTSPVIR